VCPASTGTTHGAGSLEGIHHRVEITHPRPYEPPGGADDESLRHTQHAPARVRPGRSRRRFVTPRARASVLSRV
jgi:hypothetical protein